MSRRKRRLVQTELEPGESLRGLAKKRGMTTKQAAREALLLWSASVLDPSMDPLFRLRPVEFKVRMRSDELEVFLYKRK